MPRRLLLAGVLGAGLSLLPATAYPASVSLVSPAGRTMDILFALWLGLSVAGVFVAIRRCTPSTRVWTLALLGIAVVVRLVVPWGLSNWYYAAPLEGPFPNAFVGSHPVVFDTDLRILAALPGANDGWLFTVRLLLGALVAPVMFLAAAQLSAHRRRAVAFALFLALCPYLVWQSRTDALHAWPLMSMATAVLGLSLRSRLGLLLGLVSLVFGAGVRLETAPALLASLLLAAALTERRRPDWGSWASVTTAAAGIAALLYWGPYWSEVVGNDAFGSSGGDQSFLAPLLSFQDPTLPYGFWIGFLSVGLVTAVGFWMRERRWTPPLALLFGTAIASAPAVATHWGLGDTATARYVTLVFPFVLLPVSYAAAEAGHVVRGRIPSLSGKVLPALTIAAVPAIALVLAWPSLVGDVECELEYRFLREHLADLPPGCQVVALEPAPHGIAHQPDLLLGLPHPLLQLNRPDLRWQMVPLGQPPLVPTEGCRAFYLGTGCSLAGRAIPPYDDAATAVANGAAEPCRVFASQQKARVVADELLHPAGAVAGRHPRARSATRPLHLRLLLVDEGPKREK